MASQDRGIRSFKECVPEGSNYFQQTLRREEKMGTNEDQALKEDTSSNEEYEELNS